MPDLNKPLYWQTCLLVCGAVILQSLSFVSIKIASAAQIPINILLIVLGFIFMAVRALVWQIILKHNQLSTVYPFNSLVQIVILVFSVFLFHEAVTLNNFLGLALMVGGVIFISRSA